MEQHLGGGADQEEEPVFALAGRGDLAGDGELDQEPLAEVEPDVAEDFRRAAAGGDRGGNGIMRHPALLGLLLGAMTLTCEPDAPWRSQFGALLTWLAGCVLLFLSLQ